MDTAAERAGEGRKAKVRDVVYLLLPDGLMIFLGLLMAPIVIIPLLTQSLPQPVAGFFNMADTTIIAIFVLEYVLKLVLAEDPASHFLDRWHLLDLAIITLPFLEAVPVAGWTIARSSPTLRLLRVVRVAAAGGRSVERRIEPEGTIPGPATPAVSTMRVRGWVEEDGAGGREFSPAELKEFLADPATEAWFDISGASRPDFPVLADILGLPVAYFESRLMKASHPGVTVTGTTRLIFVQEPEQTLRIRKGVRVPVVTTTGLVIVSREKTIVTVSKAEDRIFEPILAGLAGSVTAGEPLAARVLYGLLDRINEAYARILSEMETGMMHLEGTPNNEMPENFLDSVFQLKRVSSVLVTSLFHQKTVTAIVARSIPATGPWAGQKSIFDALADETIYLHETAGNIREGLLSLIDVHINTVSYEMNRAMRVIAVLSALVLIPTLIGQVLGMNILETPFELYLWEVTAWTVISMLVVGWVFYRLGWLR
ncbi:MULTISPECIES: CorA family divalent cation transporter [unclassified Methanoculleus]|uniref:CorA family divalent cation transporter n=1 Tax=unclassified Methanoculleus TaxID=2619537 RepID=UPI0025D93554|nr:MULTISPECIES: CorA family divalent cation transporter [unclassified Methanoculleus]MCK9317199.1 ion transporter [Methanoculleus sp.]MDD2253770.1 CorA family divalent cation transporter [Methanoculleus sp.]MDD2787765.1 CorA family divalent cation transporter [Methanoculleus sp.]MDD3216584.1 CorA family divalent cation transporter [Methanoculleus sp.]MDD4314607.1 CorA family divalent cation transporter [Methanoculleus sp.]